MKFKRTLLIISIIAGSSALAMDRLPVGIIKKIASHLARSNWRDEQQVLLFGLQSMALVNHHWNKAMAGLKATDFPYLAY